MKKVPALALILALTASLVFFVRYAYLRTGFDGKSLASLGRQAGEIRDRFDDIVGRIRAGGTDLRPVSDPVGIRRSFALFKDGVRDADSEGLALYDRNGSLVVWYGRVMSLGTSLVPKDIESIKRLGSPFVIRDKASVFLAHVISSEEGTGFIVRFRLLAFIPGVGSPYIREYQALGRTFRTGFKVDYWDFREDVSGFDSFFARNSDTYVGSVRKPNGVRTMFFPLRGGGGRIMATVTLTSQPMSARLSAIKEQLALALMIIGALAALAMIFFILASAAVRTWGRTRRAGFIVLLAAAARFLVLPVPGLGMAGRFPFFSPSACGFSFPAGLMGSPFDILMTMLFFLTAALCLPGLAGGTVRRQVLKGRPAVTALAAAFGLAAGAALVLYQSFVRVMAANSSLSLDRWPAGWTAMSLHLALAAGLAAAAAVIYALFKAAIAMTGKSRLAAAALVLPGAALLLLAGGPGPWPIAAGRLAVFLVPLGAVLRDTVNARRITALVFLTASAFWMSNLLTANDRAQTRKLIETTIKHAAASQETWGKFLLDQAFSELERSQRSIVSFLRNPSDPDFARSLWSRTSVAGANWYSCLEVRGPAGNIMSRFALNVPKFYGDQPALEPSDNWTTVHASIEFLGEKKEFLVGYRDLSDETSYLGRLIIYLSLDPEMLPFTYTANPYFEALRANPMPSLNQFDFGYAVFDRRGNDVFNPRSLSWRPTAVDIGRLTSPASSAWVEFRDRDTAYDACIFPSGESVQALFMPHRKFRTRVVALLQVFFVYLALVSAVLLVRSLIAGRMRLAYPVWSFSSKVYAAFLGVALVPLLLYSVLTTDLFVRFFNQTFIRDSAARTEYARSLMEAFLAIQGRQGSPYLAPSEDMALWISATLSNDINIFSDGILTASSRGEIYSSGLVPDILDGEAYAALVFENRPYFAKKVSLGGYSYQTLIIPYRSGARTLFISLPFPFEEQELARATGEIAEFLVLLSALFVVLVIVISRSIRSIIIVPVGKLLSATRAVGMGSLDVEIRHDSRDEMMTLIEGFNAMVKNLKAREQELAEMSKKVAWAEMAGKVAHDIKNPLTPIQLSAEHVLKVYEDKRGDFDHTLRESISYIIKEVEHLRRISQEFMELARDKAIDREPVDIREVLEDVVAPYRSVLSDRIDFVEDYRGPGFTISGDSDKLHTAFRNIIANATEAVAGRGRIAIAVEGGRDPVRCSISDSGPGMSRTVLDRIFDAYFSTKESGTGLGLPIARKIVEEHGGTIRVESVQGSGTTVVVELPTGTAGPSGNLS